MSLENKGSMATTVTVSLEPDRSGNFVCDGTADQTEINAAIIYVGAMGGGIVHIKECPIGVANYDITASIIDAGYDNVILEGEGWNTILKVSAAIDLIHLTSCDNWVIRDLAVDGNSGQGLSGVVLDTTNFMLVENLYIPDFDQTGIYPLITDDSHFLNNYIHDIDDGAGEGVGIRLGGAGAGCYRNVIERNRINTTGEHCIKVYAPADAETDYSLNIVTANTVAYPKQSAGAAFGIVAAANGTIVSDNGITCAGTQYGIRVEGEGCTVDDNEIEMEVSNNSCILVQGTRGTYSGNVGHFPDKAGGAFLDVDAAYNTFIGNVSHGGYYGASISTNGDYNRFVDNIFDSDRVVFAAGSTRNYYGAGQSYLLGASVVDNGTNNAFPEFWVPIFDDTHAQVSLGNIGDHFGVMMANNQDATFRFSFTVPSDFAIPMDFILELITVSANPTIRWSLDTDWGQCGEAYNTGSDSKALGNTNLVQNDISCMEIGLLAGYPFDTMTGDDRVGVLFTREGSHGDDDAGDVLVRGFRVRYV